MWKNSDFEKGLYYLLLAMVFVLFMAMWAHEIRTHDSLFDGEVLYVGTK